MNARNTLIIIAVAIFLLSALGAYTDFVQNREIRDLKASLTLYRSVADAQYKVAKSDNQLLLEALRYAVSKEAVNGN